jgi:MFS family permease
MWAWFLAWFLLEIPSGYFSDIFWHKKTILLWKISFLFSVFFYILASFVSYPLIAFILAMFFQMVWKVAASGSDRAILYDSLKNLNREKEFTKIQTKISATSSLLSTLIILGIPFLTKISIIFPFYFVFLQYLFWVWVVLLLVDTENHKNINKENKKKIKQVVKENRWFWLFPYLLFWYLLNSVLFADAAYRPLYMEDLWLPIILMWSAMWISRFMWYVFHPLAYKLETKFKLRHVYLIQLVFLFVYYLLIAYLNNPYVVAILFWVWIWFIRSLKDIPTHFIIKNIKDDNYKATMISVAGQVWMITQAILTFVAGFIMNISYKLWFFSFAIIMLVMLWINYIFILKSNIEK